MFSSSSSFHPKHLPGKSTHLHISNANSLDEIGKLCCIWVKIKCWAVRYLANYCKYRRSMQNIVYPFLNDYSVCFPFIKLPFQSPECGNVYHFSRKICMYVGKSVCVLQRKRLLIRTFSILTSAIILRRRRRRRWHQRHFTFPGTRLWLNVSTAFSSQHKRLNPTHNPPQNTKAKCSALLPPSSASCRRRRRWLLVILVDARAWWLS